MSGAWFSWVHGNNLVYNACWEDPRIDRVALELTPEDTVMLITSGGCNALDYALQEPRHVYAVDMNYRQNALLELKLAGLRTLEFEPFFQLFGTGRLPGFQKLYRAQLRPLLSPTAQVYWDDHAYFFDARGNRNSFYFHGTCGYFAWLMNCYLNRRPRLRAGVNALLNAATLEEQQDVYYGWFSAAFWNRFLRWAMRRDTTLSLLGVPQAQRRQVEQHYEGGIAKFIEDCIEAVFAQLPLGDNYFWRVYLTGEYTPDCCPEYLRRENFARLKGGLADRVSVHTTTVQRFLEEAEEPVSRLVLLDHMDWLSHHRRDLLAGEWQAIVDRAAPNARVLWRSGGMQVDFVDPVHVRVDGETIRVGDLLTYHPAWAAELHRHDRVHTYGSFYIADLAAT
jgi:S-adenosylmethionine-diacylglycerol 3-amino-3-carboxypropyl transferase